MTPKLASVRKMERHEDGWLYFMQSIIGGPVKIGSARDPQKRLADFQTGSPIPLQIIAACPGAGDQEHEVHHALSHAWIRGEWYEAVAVYDYLRRYGITDEQLEASGAYLPLPEVELVTRADPDIVTGRVAA